MSTLVFPSNILFTSLFIFCVRTWYLLISLSEKSQMHGIQKDEEKLWILSAQFHSVNIPVITTPTFMLQCPPGNKVFQGCSNFEHFVFQGCQVRLWSPFWKQAKIYISVFHVIFCSKTIDFEIKHDIKM